MDLSTYKTDDYYETILGTGDEELNEDMDDGVRKIMYGALQNLRCWFIRYCDQIPVLGI